MIRLLLALLLMVSGYASVATWWILKEPSRLQAAERKVLAESAKIQRETFNAGEAARDEVREVFYPIKDELRATAVDVLCVGEFDSRVQSSLEKARTAANIASGLPTAVNTPSARTASDKRDSLGERRSPVGRRDP